MYLAGNKVRMNSLGRSAKEKQTCTKLWIPFFFLPNAAARCPMQWGGASELASQRQLGGGGSTSPASWIPSLYRLHLLKFRRVTIRGAQPSARLSEEICLSEGSAGVSQRAPRGLSEGSAGSLWGSAGVRGIFRGFRGSDPVLVTLRNCWITPFPEGNSAFSGAGNPAFSSGNR